MVQPSPACYWRRAAGERLHQTAAVRHTAVCAHVTQPRRVCPHNIYSTHSVTSDMRRHRQTLTEWWAAGMVICLERVADLHMAQLMPLPLTVSFFSKIQIGFTFLVPAHPGSPGKRAVRWVCVCVYLLTVDRTANCVAVGCGLNYDSNVLFHLKITEGLCSLTEHFSRFSTALALAAHWIPHGIVLSCWGLWSAGFNST